MALVNIVPAMTSNTAPSGVAFASSSYTSTPAWNAFATLGTQNGWLNNGNGFPVTLGYQSDAAHIVTAYDMYPWDVDNFPVRCPKDFQFQGSNDGTTWVTLDTRSGITNWVSGSPMRFTFTNATAYLSHRVYITSNNGDGYTGMRHLNILSDTAATTSVPPNFLAHFDGVNGATTTVDSSGNNYSVTLTGGPSLSTASPVFGSAAAHFTGSGFGTIDPAISNIPSGDFTISMRFKSSQAGVAYNTLLSRSVGSFAAGAWTILLSDGSANGRPQIYWADYSTSAAFMTSSNAGYNDGLPHMLVWDRKGNIHQLFIDGVSVATATTAVNFTESTSGMTIGNDTAFGGRAFVGDIDELALFYGTSLYNASFTPPTAAYSGAAASAPAVSPSTGSGSSIERADTASGSSVHSASKTSSGMVIEANDTASGSTGHSDKISGSGNVVESLDVGYGLTRPFFASGKGDRLAFKLGQWHRSGPSPDYLVDSSVNHMRIVNGDPVHIKPSVYGSSDPYGSLPGISFESTIANSGLLINDSRFAAGYGDFLLGLNFKRMGPDNTPNDQYLFDGTSANNFLDGLIVYITNGHLVVSRVDGLNFIFGTLISSANTTVEDQLYIERHNGVLRIVLNGAVVFSGKDNSYFSSPVVTIGSSFNGNGNTNFNGLINDLFFYNGVSPLYGHITPGLVAHAPIEHFTTESSWFQPSISNAYIADIDYGVAFQFNGDFTAVARLDSTFSSGKFYWESGSYYNTGLVSFGLVDDLTDGDFVLGSNALSIGYKSDGSVMMGGSVVATFSPFTNANTVGLAVDMNASPPNIHFFLDGVSKGVINLPMRSWRPAFSFNGGPEAIYFSSDPTLLSYPQAGYAKLSSSLPSTRSSSGSVIESIDPVIGKGSKPLYGFNASIALPVGSASGATVQPNTATGRLSLSGSGYGGGLLSGNLSLKASMKATTIAPGVMVATLKLTGLMSATTGSAAIGVSKIFLPSGSASGGGFIRSVSPLPSGQARGASGASGIAVGRLVLTGSASATTYRPTIAIATIPLPRFFSTSRTVAKISLPVGVAKGRTFLYYKLVGGVPVETFNTDGWVLNLKKRNGENPEKEPLCQASNWTDFPMRQMVRFHEDYYGIGFDGKLYKLGGKTDNGSPIEWKITTAMTDFGIIQRKAVGAVYLGARIENTVTVGIHQDELSEDPFPIPITRGMGPHTARARLARGYDARYYGFSVSNSGGTADINTINLEVKPKERA